MKFMHQFKHELDKKSKNSKKLSYFDIFLISLAFVSIIYKVSNDTQIYFYNNYLVFSLTSVGLIYFIFGFGIPRFLNRDKFSSWYYLSIILLGFTLSFWYIPKLLHYNYLEKGYKCTIKQIDYKYFSYTSGNVGRVSFVRDYNLDDQLDSLRVISGIPKETFDLLPKVGQRIHVCGNLTRIGFTYKTFDIIK